MFKFDRARVRLGVAVLSVGIAVGAVALADDHAPAPPDDENMTTAPAC